MKTTPYKHVPTLPNWSDQAACAHPTIDAEIFFPPEHEHPTRRAQRETKAQAVCATCPVRAACDDHATRHHIPEGIWGGRTPHQRGDVRANRNHRRQVA